MGSSSSKGSAVQISVWKFPDKTLEVLGGSERLSKGLILGTAVVTILLLGLEVRKVP